MKNRLVLALLLLFTLTGLGTDTQDSAIATNLGLYGGPAFDLASDPFSDTVYMTTDGPNGLFVSSDLGNSWVGLPTDVNYGSSRDITVDPDSGNVYATVGDSLLRSTDQGSTWEDITANLAAGFAYGLIMDHERLLVALQNGVIAVSDDHGDSFTEVTIDEDVEVVYLVASPNTDVFFASVTDTDDVSKIYQSTDGGETWTDLAVTSNGMASGTSIWKLAVNPTDGDNLVTTSGVSTSTNYITTDGGDTWSAIDNGSGVAFDSTGRLYVGFQYTDNPTASSPTWESYETNTPLSTIAADLIIIDPEDENIIFNNSGMGLAISRDRTASWEDSIDGVTSVKVYDISQTADKTIVWLGANGGLAKTENFTDDEPTWEYPIAPVPGASNIHAVWVNPNNADDVVSDMGAGMAYSIDGGETWTNATVPTYEGLVYEIVSSRLNENTLYAAVANDDLTGTDNGMVLMSTDLGATWTDLGFELPASSLAIASDDTLYVGVTGDVSAPGVYVYDGSSWSNLNGAVEDKIITSVLVHPSNDDQLFVTVNEGNLYTSIDRGESWTKVTNGLEDATNFETFVAQTTTSPVTLYLSGQDGSSLNGMVYKSSDGGDSWGEYYEGLKQEGFYAMFFDGLMAGNDRGIYDIKSRAKLKLQEKNKRNVTVSLRDVATAKRLKHKTVKLYRKKDGDWKKIDSVKTNVRGRATIKVNVANGTKLKATWKPSAKDRREYAKASSKVLRFGGI